MAAERVAGQPIFRFGVVADPQYAPVAPSGTRYYSNTLGKLSEAIKVFNKENPAFVVTLGDIIDRDWGSYAHVLPVYERSSTRTSLSSETTISRWPVLT